MQLKYLLGCMLMAPILPLMYVQGKRIRSSVPTLPEAKGSKGYVDIKAEKDFNTLLIGESTISGVGVNTHEEGFAGSFSAQLAELTHTNIRWRVYAKSGYTAQDVHDKIVPKIKEAHADLIVIGLGGNDAFGLNSPNKWEKSIHKLIQSLRVKHPSSPIIFTNMPPIKEFPAFTPLIKFSIGNLVEMLGTQLEKMVHKMDNVYYHSMKITLKEWNERLGIEANPSYYFSDGVHPSKETYQVWGSEFAKFVNSLGFLDSRNISD